MHSFPFCFGIPSFSFFWERLWVINAETLMLHMVGWQTKKYWYPKHPIPIIWVFRRKPINQLCFKKRLARLTYRHNWVSEPGHRTEDGGRSDSQSHPPAGERGSRAGFKQFNKLFSKQSARDTDSDIDWMFSIGQDEPVFLCTASPINFAKTFVLNKCVRSDHAGYCVLCWLGTAVVAWVRCRE